MSQKPFTIGFNLYDDDDIYYQLLLFNNLCTLHIYRLGLDRGSIRSSPRNGIGSTFKKNMRWEQDESSGRNDLFIV